MFTTVEVPLWLLLFLLAFAALGFAPNVLFPPVRMFLRRRMKRAVAEINQRLQQPIRSFELARRYDTIQRLIYDPKVIEAVTAHARTERVSESSAFRLARRYAREIVPSFSATAYFGIAIRLARYVSRALFHVRLSYRDEDAIQAIDPDATVIFAMNHRSNMDYVLITYLAAERSALSYAVGEWANVWPLRGLIRAMGAYFIRRNSGDTLYRQVLSRYVQLATANGVTQAIFPEGRLSQDGNVRQPKLGILSYVLSDFDPASGRDVVFVPVALNYDRVLEDRVLLRAARERRRGFRFSVLPFLTLAFRQIRFKLTGRFHRFGYAAVRFGAPLSLRDFAPDGGPAKPEDVGRELMRRIRLELPILPVPLAAHVLSRAAGPLHREEFLSRAAVLARELQAGGAHVHLPPGGARAAGEAGLRMLELRKMVLDGSEGFHINPPDASLVAFYAASVSQALDAGAA